MSKTTIPAGGITDGTLTSAKLDQDGAFTFNEDSADVDFRVESNGETDMIFADGGLSAVGINCSPNVEASNGGGDLSTSVYSLQVAGASGATGKVAMGSNGPVNAYVAYSQVNAGGSNILTSRIEGQMDTTTAGSEVGSMEFYTMTGGSIVERMRIKGSGQIDVNPNSTALGTQAFRVFGAANNTVMEVHHANTSGTETLIEFRDGQNQNCGEINILGSSNEVTYNTSSDYRLKENISYDWDATTRLKQLKPARFNFISDETNTVKDGFIAHEVSDIVPNAIHNNKDQVQTYRENDIIPEGKSVGDNITWTQEEIDKGQAPSGTSEGDAKPQYQTIDHSKLVPLLVKTVQELEARIATLEG